MQLPAVMICCYIAANYTELERRARRFYGQERGFGALGKDQLAPSHHLGGQGNSVSSGADDEIEFNAFSS